ncbi:hypothetical protein DM806_08930 [Sphingobium lactosutens]|nr:hypothetical protein [Sphingobium lactosutens]
MYITHFCQSSARAIELAGAAYDVRGYGPVKDASVEEYDLHRQALLSSFDAMPIIAERERIA